MTAPDVLHTLVQQINNQAIHRQIDILGCQLYGLTDEEIHIDEGGS
jgi:hypothetical protein